MRVWDSTAEIRYLVVPMRPAGTEGWSEDEARGDRDPRLHDRHRTRDAARMNGPHDMGGFAGFGRVEPEAAEPVFHEPWEARSFALVLAMGMTGAWNIDAARYARERLAPLTYWSSSYYEMRHHALVDQLTALGLVTAAEEHAGRSEWPPLPWPVCRARPRSRRSLPRADLRAGMP